MGIFITLSTMIISKLCFLNTLKRGLFLGNIPHCFVLYLDQFIRHLPYFRTSASAYACHFLITCTRECWNRSADGGLANSFEKVVLISPIAYRRGRSGPRLQFHLVIILYPVYTFILFNKCVSHLFLWDQKLKISSCGLNVPRQHSNENAFGCYRGRKSIIRSCLKWAEPDLV